VEGLLALWLFGSFARGEATPISDVDLAFLSDKAFDGEGLECFERELYLIISDVLRTDEFALVNLRRAPGFFAWQILAEGRMLFCRDAGAVAEAAEAVYRYAPEIRRMRHVSNADFLETFVMASPKVDRERLAEFLRLISDDLRTLREKAQASKAAYSSSRDAQAIVERRLQTATESAINIGNHVIARSGLRAPQDYADVFRILGDAGVLPKESVEHMVDMARFRNLLVHVYWAIDHDQVHESLPRRLRALEAFSRYIAQWLRERDAS
jgi:uncharacterized protein YutE (UPF0331/DUF86 family)/predicted nucleotidyltransferase